MSESYVTVYIYSFFVLLLDSIHPSESPMAEPSTALDVHAVNTALGNRLIALYANINAAHAQFLELLAQFDEAGSAVDAGCRSSVEWLSWHCGIHANAAREKLRVARALFGTEATLPQLAEAFRGGRISYSKVRALTRVVTHADEAHLLEIAKHASAAQLERIAREYRQGLADAGQVSDETRCDVHWDTSGHLVIRARLDATQGALFLKALERLCDKNRLGEDDARSADARRADALTEMAHTALTEGSDQAGAASADRYQIHVELGSDGASPAATLERGPSLTQAATERLLCDASLVLHQTDAEGEPLSVGRKTRTIPGAIRRALRRRDGGCRFPGCGQTRFVDAHHVQHWAHGGETRLDNLVLLCRHHHTAVHDRGFTVRVERPDRGAVRFKFFSPQGVELTPANADLSSGSVQRLFDEVSAVTPNVPTTFFPEMGDARPDYNHINWVLMLKRLE